MKRQDDMTNDEHNQMMSSSMSMKTAQKKAMKNMQNMQQLEHHKIKNNGANISQSSVVSTNTNHKNSQGEEISVQSSNVQKQEQV